MKGYKAFDNGMICNGKQYAENTVFEFEEDDGRFMYFCAEPIDILDDYPIVNNKSEINEFAKVEAYDPKTDDNKNYFTKKLKIGEKISFAELVLESVNFKYKKKNKVKKTKKHREKIASRDDSKNISSIGEYAKICSSGDMAKIDSRAFAADIASSGDDAQISSRGGSDSISSSGYKAKIASIGPWAKICSSGDEAQIGSNGLFAKIASSGDDVKIASSGSIDHIASSGDKAHIASIGDTAHIASSGDDAQINSTGKYSVICCAGNNSRAKGKKGSWITLSEWKYTDDENGKTYIPVCVKTEKIDGVKIKEDTFYMLKNGEFVAVIE